VNITELPLLGCVGLYILLALFDEKRVGVYNISDISF
jgi:hypothetical protein